MTFQLTCVQEPDYLHVIVTGENNKENVAAYLEAMHHEALARGARRILIEERMDGPRLSMFDVFEIVSRAAARAVGNFQAIAFVDANGSGDIMNFAEDVAVNRSVPMAVFRDVEDARRWLVKG